MQLKFTNAFFTYLKCVNVFDILSNFHFQFTKKLDQLHLTLLLIIRTMLILGLVAFTRPSFLFKVGIIKC